MTILNQIISKKRKEVQVLKKQTFKATNSKKATPFKDIVEQQAKMSMIAEIKRSSPSKGAIQMEVNPVKQALAYELHGAAAISVLTDESFFNGSMHDLQAVRSAVDLPILCKDFIINPVQIDQAKAYGANIILLIVAALNKEDLTMLYHYALDLHLEVICEVHNEAEMTRAIGLGAEIIGINNRNLKTFKVDLNTTKRLAAMITDDNTILISESGIRTKADVEQAKDAGATVILVGETLMRSSDLEAMFNQLLIPLH